MWVIMDVKTRCMWAMGERFVRQGIAQGRCQHLREKYDNPDLRVVPLEEYRRG